MTDWKRRSPMSEFRNDETADRDEAEGTEENDLQTLPDQVVAPEENPLKVAHEDLPVESEEQAEAVGVDPQEAAETTAADVAEDKDNEDDA
jgi:hypothetical protein